MKEDTMAPEATGSLENTEVKKAIENENSPQSGFRFFKNCSASLKRFSVLIFAINIFLIVVALIVGVALVVIYLGTDLLSLLAFPIISVVIILVILARFVSSLIYGFAEIVEKNEK